MASDIECSYYRDCLRVQQMIKLPGSLLDLDNKFNKCYCRKCHEIRGESYSFRDGPKPHNLYTKPVGWGRIMLKLPPRAEHFKIFSDWNVAFHGTSPDKLLPIIEAGEFLLPGDKTMAGDTIREVDGHFNDDSKPDGFDTKQVFLSPSIKYAGCEVYAKKRKLYLRDRYVDIRTVLQVRVKPDQIHVGPETIGRSSPIDPPVDNDTIEWCTSARNSVIPTAVLIQVIESPDPVQSKSVCPICRALFGKNLNTPSRRTCRHKYVICQKCDDKFKDIYGNTCVLCSEPTQYHLEERRGELESIMERAMSFARARLHYHVACSGESEDDEGKEKEEREKDKEEDDENEEEEIEILVRAIDMEHRQNDLHVYPSCTIFQLKCRIQNYIGIPPKEQQLVFMGKPLLNNNATLRSYGLRNESSVHIVKRMLGD